MRRLSVSLSVLVLASFGIGFGTSYLALRAPAKCVNMAVLGTPGVSQMEVVGDVLFLYEIKDHKCINKMPHVGPIF